MAYSRSFIILDDNDGNKERLGKCVEERRENVKISVFAQGLPPSSSFAVYIFTKNGENVKLGKFFADEKGRGELKNTFDTLAPIEKISIMAEKNGILTPVLSSAKTAPIPIIKESVKEKPPEPPKKEEPKKEEEPDIYSVFKEMSAQVKEKLREIKEPAEIPRLTPFTDDEEIKLKPQKTEEIDYVYENNPKITPFPDETANWAKIGLRELVYLPVSYFDIVNNGIVLVLNRRYKHMILGRENKKYSLGVPCSHKDERELLQKSGFAKFCPTAPADSSDLAKYENTGYCVRSI
ncbi:hypothetical protein AGMMS49975_04240 [Clostridia bacterium]|nr:hypothetical protein AGMMS49975_04240 [Clostridia bacterium]